MNTAPKEHKTPHSYYAILVLTLCASFLFYKYIIQNFPSVMSTQLMTDFNLHGVGLGMLSGGYFWTYLITPLFVGAIIDRYGARWVSTLAILSCAIGVYWFSQIQDLNMAIVTRAIMGFGVSFATIAYMKLAANWFSPKKYPLLIGLVVTAAMAGAVFGQMPLAWLVKQVGWRNSLSDIGIAGFVLALLFLLIVREKPDELDNPELVEPPITLADIAQIFKSPQNWLLFFYNGLAFSPIVIFGGLWGNPFLQVAYSMDAVKASSLISLIFIGLGVGGPVFALISERLNTRRNLMAYSTLVSALSMILVLYCHPMPIWLVGALLFTFGFSLGAFSLVFVIGKEINPLKLAGTAIAMINASDALLDAITEPAVGKLLDVLDPQIGVAGIHVFSLHSYHLALGLLPLYQIVSVILLYWVKKD
jgi:MFS family permease